MEDTLSLIREIDDLLIHTPDDVDLKQVRDSLKASLEQPQDSSDSISTSSSLDCSCCIPFPSPRSSRTVLLPARVLPSNDPDLVDPTNVLVSILTPLTHETVPCPSLTSSTNCAQPCHYSHGYSINRDWLLPIEALDINSPKDGLVWYNNSTTTEEVVAQKVWHRGTLHSSSTERWITDSLGVCQIAGETQIIPLVYLDDEDHLSPTLPDHTTALPDDDDDDDDADNSPIEKTASLDKTWGAWQSHTNRSGEKMMQKMGYVQGEGLGLGGQGRRDPVQAYQMGQRYNQDNRPGLGSLTTTTTRKEKKKAKTVAPPNMHDERGPETNPQKRLWQLEEKVDRLNKERRQGLAAVHRNKGTLMEQEFQNNVQRTTKELALVIQERDRVQARLTRAKTMADMISF